MYNVVKWPNILLKSCGVNTARFLKYVWPFYNIIHERVNMNNTQSYLKFQKYYQQPKKDTYVDKLILLIGSRNL